jgi:hypothetical protein
VRSSVASAIFEIFLLKFDQMRDLPSHLRLRLAQL